MLRLIVNAYTDPDPVRNAELLDAAAINAALFDDVLPIPGRPTFAEMFAAANAVASPEDISVVANSDVSFDETLGLAAEHLDHQTCWALSRDDMERQDSQDAWVFRGSICIPAAHFPPGIPGCDNRLAWLLRHVGYQVLNPCRSVRVRHHHASGLRNYRRGIDRVPGPYLRVAPQKLPTRVAQ